MTRTAQFFTFGLFLVVVGAIGKFFDWDQANVIMALGLLFESIAAMLYTWNKLKSKN